MHYKCKSFNEVFVVIISSIIIKQLFSFFYCFFCLQNHPDFSIDCNSHWLDVWLLTPSNSINQTCYVAKTIRIKHSWVFCANPGSQLHQKILIKFLKLNICDTDNFPKILADINAFYYWLTSKYSPTFLYCELNFEFGKCWRANIWLKPKIIWFFSCSRKSLSIQWLWNLLNPSFGKSFMKTFNFLSAVN